MKLLGLVITLGAVLGAVTVASAAGSSHTTVRPAVGTPASRFVVRFTAPAPSGRSSSMVRGYWVTTSGPSHHGCDSADTQAARAQRAGQRVRVTLAAPGPARRWCRGAFTGTVHETIAPECRAGMMCPMYIAVRVLGRFAFRVN